MDIEFIKWMCEKAEGFEWKNSKQIGITGLHCDNKFFSWNGPLFNPVIIPLLLQRAIEGVNRKDKVIMIRNEYDTIIISERFEEYKTYYFGKDNPDKAKESALKYIYKQETK